MGRLGIDDSRLGLISKRIPEENISGLNLIKDALAVEKKKPRILWGNYIAYWKTIAHIGYFIPLLKFVEFLSAGLEVIVLLLDVYSFLDNVKYPMEQVLQRMQYYKFTVIAALEALGVPSSKIEFIQESSYQFSKEYITDQWKLCTLIPQQAVRDAWDRSYNPDILSPMLCPGLQALSEPYCEVDMQFGGTDQGKLFDFAENFLPQLGYKKRAHLMNPMLPNLLGGKMSSSHPPNTKIMFLDDYEAIRNKIHQVYKLGGVPAQAVLITLRDILFPASELRLHDLKTSLASDLRPESNIPPRRKPFRTEDAPAGTLFSVQMQGVDGNPSRHYRSYKELEQNLAEGLVSADALTGSITDALYQLLETVRKMYEENAEWQKVEKLGYPGLE